MSLPPFLPIARWLKICSCPPGLNSKVSQLGHKPQGREVAATPQQLPQQRFRDPLPHLTSAYNLKEEERARKLPLHKHKSKNLQKMGCVEDVCCLPCTCAPSRCPSLAVAEPESFELLGLAAGSLSLFYIEIVL